LHAQVTVVADSGASATDLDSQEPVDEQRLQEIHTVEECFAFIREAVEQEAEVLSVEYDEALSYPTRIESDWRFDTADDELSIFVTDLEPGKGE
jgi:hypothetical protein